MDRPKSRKSFSELKQLRNELDNSNSFEINDNNENENMILSLDDNIQYKNNSIYKQ